VSDANKAQLDELDARVEAALLEGDEKAFNDAVASLDDAVRLAGTPVDPTTFLPSDLVLPHQGATLAEVEELLASEEASI
jgi:hypothetical protein